MVRNHQLFLAIAKILLAFKAILHSAVQNLAHSLRSGQVQRMDTGHRFNNSTLQQFIEIIAFIIHQDEGRKFFHTDAVNGFHA